MPLWSNKTGGNEKPPTWLSVDQQKHVYATKKGWTYKHLNGDEEVLVAISNLDTKLAAPNITGIYFSGNNASLVQAANTTVTLDFNEKVKVLGAPTITVNGTVANAVATYTSGSNTNQIVFTFHVPSSTQVLSLIGQTIASNSTVGIVDNANNAVAAQLVFANTVVLPIRGKNSGNTTISIA